jgi:hypothetical protein
MTSEQKKALFIFGAGVLLFFLLKPKTKKKVDPSMINFTESEEEPKERSNMVEPTINPNDFKKNDQAKAAYGVLKAYVAAYNNKEPQSVLDELNREFAKEFKLKVYRRKSDSKLVVCDLQGEEVLVS